MYGALLVWLVSLTGLFATNLNQHVAGGILSWRMHEMMAAIQALWNSCMLNALSRRAGWKWTVPELVAFVTAVLATMAVATATLVRPEWQEPVCGIVQAFTSPLIVGTMGRHSWSDKRAWWLFKRSCVGIVLVLGVVGVEKHVCQLGNASAYFHALVDHACIWCMFGGVAQNAVHLVGRSLQKTRSE